MKKKHAFSIFFVLLCLISCKKTDDSRTHSAFWSGKRAEISAKIKTEFSALKGVLKQSLQNKDGVVIFDDAQTNKILNVSKELNKRTKIEIPKNTSELITSLKISKRLSNSPVGPSDPTPPETDPAMALLAEGYRAQYWAATENYTELSSYLTQLDGIALGLTYDLYNSEAEKIQILNEIEWLKAYATSLEQDPDYWINLYAPEPILEPVPTLGLAKGSPIMSISPINKFMSGGRLHCKVDTRKALMTGVVTGLRAGVAAGYTGATAGTVAIPVIGTVTGGVSGFMGGFASGFLSGTVTSVVIQLALTCLR
ncbi:hypothetical protein [Pedobacter suwonensis]|uniref:hypothetical protein n=1 Tax=Pedobacter suwonensis TaxID=332999 RepID=UPI0011A559FA|nr:hypothetical protein [Pedobacter suwonensis]